MMEETGLNSVELATELTVAWLGNQNNRIVADDVPAFLRSMHDAVEQLKGGGQDRAESGSSVTHQPAVSVRKSLASRDHIISMIDGKPYRSLRRHLTGQGLTPAQYRERYGLKPDYPMVAPSYSETRRNMALKIGLGAKGRAAKTAAKPSRSPAKRG